MRLVQGTLNAGGFFIQSSFLYSKGTIEYNFNESVLRMLHTVHNLYCHKSLWNEFVK